jgi:hypothetical protein
MARMMAFRCPEHIRRELHETADREGVSASEYIRRSLSAAVGLPYPDPDHDHDHDDERDERDDP